MITSLPQRISAVCTAMLVAIGIVSGSTYIVSTTGIDDATRNGTSQATAWKTLSFACNQVQSGPHEIRLGPGTFTETQSSSPKSGITITGNGTSGAQATIIKPSTTWTLTGKPSGFSASNYLIAIKTWEMGFSSRVNTITISNIQFATDTTHRIDGAFFFWDCDKITIHDISIRDFRWTGMYLAFDSALTVYNCDITNCNTVEDGYWSGNIHTKWIKNSTFHDIISINTIKGNWGVGYKGGGHEHVNIYNSTFSGEGFDIEIPFENEYGVEISGCKFGSPISIPKPGQGDNPNSRGSPYTFWIHDNYMTSSYTIEGPRNHLMFDHNFVQISTNTNGRVYSQFGGNTNGPIWIHHNVIENVDRAFIWKGSGQLDSMYVYNNTVYCANAADRAAPVLDSWDNMKGWMVKNNIFVAPASQHRRLGPTYLINASNNVCLNIDSVPPGNFSNQDPQLALAGAKPTPFYAPLGASSFVVNKGVDVGYPFVGSAPDIGAYENGSNTSINVSISRLGLCTFAAHSIEPLPIIDKRNRSAILGRRVMDAKGRVSYFSDVTIGAGWYVGQMHAAHAH